MLSILDLFDAVQRVDFIQGAKPNQVRSEISRNTFRVQFGPNSKISSDSHPGFDENKRKQSQPNFSNALLFRERTATRWQQGFSFWRDQWPYLYRTRPQNRFSNEIIERHETDSLAIPKRLVLRKR